MGIVVSEVALVSEYYIRAAYFHQLDPLHILKSLGLPNEQIEKVSILEGQNGEQSLPVVRTFVGCLACPAAALYLES